MSNKNKLNTKKKIKLDAKIKAFQNLNVKVGFPKESSETNSMKDGATALEKATANNYGLGNNPERPFMDIAFSKNKK